MKIVKPFEVHIEVRFRDLDAMGHVNNSVMFTYFEEGRKTFFSNILNRLGPSGFNFILAHIQCDYLKPVKLNDRPLLQMWIIDIGNKSFKFQYQLVDVSDHEMVYSKGESIQVCYDYKKDQSIPVSSEIRRAMEPFIKK